MHMTQENMQTSTQWTQEKYATNAADANKIFRHSFDVYNT